MLKKTMTYTDFDGNERTEDFYFRLSQPELVEMELSAKGGLEATIKRIVAAKDTATLINIFKEVVLKAYGEKSADGKRFIKSPEISKAFSETTAYEQLYMELVFDAEKAADFVNGIVPQNK